MGMMNRMTLGDGKKSSSEATLNTNLVKTYKTLNKFLRSFFEMVHIILIQNIKEFPFTTRPKTMPEKIFSATPETTKGAVLLQDPIGISQCLLIGVENHLLVMYIALFYFIDTNLNNTMIAALIILVLDMIIKFTRLYLGEINIAKKSLLDSKFLI
jgi:hypothetical protein